MGMLSIVTLDIRSYAWAYHSIVRLASAHAGCHRCSTALPMSIYVGAYLGIALKTRKEYNDWQPLRRKEASP